MNSPFGTTQLCLGWSQATDPVAGVDFQVVYSSTLVPSVFLRTGDADWRITNTNLLTGLPADIGTVALRPSTANEDFAISIGTTLAAGANNVTSIDLRGTGFLTATPWSGYSRINGGRIAGNLGKGLSLRSDAAAMGGDVIGDFWIDGNLSGLVGVTLIDGAALYVQGKSNASISITRIVNGSFDLGSHFSGKLAIEKELLDSRVTMGGDITEHAFISINEMNSSFTGTSVSVDLNQGGEPATKSFAGTLLLKKGIPQGQIVNVLGLRAESSIIDFNDHDIAGWLEASGGGWGEMIRGGVIRSSGHVWAAAWPTAVFHGKCTFAGMDRFSVLETETSQNAGTFHITGDMNGQMWARVSELLETGVFQVDGDVGPDGSILTSSWGGSFPRPGDMKGRVEIGGDVYGWMEFAGSITKGASIKIGGSLNNRLVIGNETHKTSKIRMGGLGAAGRVEVASNNPFQATTFDANGGILVGVPSGFISPVTFDGCVRVHSNSTGGGGDLNGKLTVRGCHATNDDLNICIDGVVNGGVSIEQFGCANLVTWSCGTCP